MAARARAHVEVNPKDLVARSPEEKRLIAVSKLGEEVSVVG